MDGESSIARVVVGGALALAILAVAGGYLGALHPIGDALAVGRGMASAAVFLLAFLAILAGMRLAAFGAILLSILTGGAVVLAYVWPGPPGPFTLYQKNMFYQNSDLAGLEADIRDAAPLAVSLQEVSDPNLALLANLQDLLPHQHHCRQAPRGGLSVASQLEPVPGSQRCGRGVAAMQVIYQDQPVWIVSVHMSWPWPYAQAAHVAELEPFLAGLEGTVLMGGDFNMVHWGVAVQRLASAARTRPAGPTGGSFLGLGPLLSLPIDHVFAPSGGRVVFRPALGSDHLGLLASLSL